MGDTQISLGRGNKREFMSGLKASGDGNMSDQACEAEGDSTERDYWKGSISKSGKNLAQGNLPGICKEDPS